jgi:hypothetical protein
LLLDLVEISKGRYNFPRTGRYDHSHHLFHFGREKPALLASNDTTSNAMPGKKARARKKKTERRDARELTKPTFDVDESVAAAVFAHVTNTRDRLALACVSKVWRKVVTSDGSWGTCDLVLEGKLGEKITDERFEDLLRYCGDVKRLEMRDAPVTFKGHYLFHAGPSFKKKFASLETFFLINCPGVCNTDILGFLQDIGMPDRPKDTRLRCLRLAGCEIESDLLDKFRKCLRNDPTETFLSDKEKISFDLWECDACGLVSETSEVTMCDACTETYCTSCAVEEGCKCTCCDFFVCRGECEETANIIFLRCDRCDEVMCQSCVFSCKLTSCIGNEGKPGCGKQLCVDCQKKAKVLYIPCQECWCSWCDECMYKPDRVGGHPDCCVGKGGCGKTICGSCSKKKQESGSFFVFCEFCKDLWCPECDPGVQFNFDTGVCKMYCPSCFGKAGCP